MIGCLVKQILCWEKWTSSEAKQEANMHMLEKRNLDKFSISLDDVGLFMLFFESISCNVFQRKKTDRKQLLAWHQQVV